MPVELLVRATDGDIGKRLQKGEIVTFHDAALLDAGIRNWGTKQVAPTYAKIRVTDATPEQVRSYKNNITDILQWELIQTFAQGRRYKLSLHPYVRGRGADIKQRIRDYLQNELGATVNTPLANGEITLDIPTPDEGWQGLKDRMRHDFEDQIDMARYKVDANVIDIVMGQDGWAETTKAQLDNNMIDKLA